MSKQMLSVGLVGATGRMGACVLKGIAQHPQLQLAAALTHSHSASLGQPIPGFQTGQRYTADFTTLAGADVIIDFALLEGLGARLEHYRSLAKPVVLCTTGLSEQQHNDLEVLGQLFPLLYAANTSLGSQVMRVLVHSASQLLGQQADIEIVEAHHTAKKDAPSGTAVELGKTAARARGQDFEKVAVLNRNQMETDYQKGSIGFAVIRAGQIVGEHTVYLVTDNERIELTHRVSSRDTFADGAIQAAIWLSTKKPDFYSIADVLGVDEKLHFS